MRRRRIRSSWRVVFVTSLAWFGIAFALFLYHIGTDCVLYGTRWDSLDGPVIHYGAMDFHEVKVARNASEDHASVVSGFVRPITVKLRI